MNENTLMQLKNVGEIVNENKKEILLAFGAVFAAITGICNSIEKRKPVENITPKEETVTE